MEHMIMILGGYLPRCRDLRQEQGEEGELLLLSAGEANPLFMCVLALCLANYTIHNFVLDQSLCFRHNIINIDGCTGIGTRRWLIFV